MNSTFNIYSIKSPSDSITNTNGLVLVQEGFTYDMAVDWLRSNAVPRVSYTIIEVYKL